MPSFTTVYRALVMIAAGVIVVKGWQLYGPTAEQTRTFGVRALEIAQNAMNGMQPAATRSEGGASDPRLAPPANISSPAPAAELQPAPPLAAPSASGPTREMPIAPAILTPVTPLGANEPGVAPSADATDELSPLLTRLEQLGVVDRELSPWGSSGRMYRFHCRAPLGDSPAFARHFEAVADEPRAAVEQVVAKVEAWRAAQRERTAQR